MKRTITVNIGNSPFHIEEEAYELLHKYLERIKLLMGSNDEAVEVVSDVESRVAELLHLGSSDHSAVVTVERINDIIKIIGEPEAFSGMQSEGGTKGEPIHNREDSEYQESSKRLRRSRQRKVFGGVCGGLSEYFSIDVALVRILFVVAFLFLVKKFVLLAYIILWIAVPKASLKEQMLAYHRDMMKRKNPTQSKHNQHDIYSRPNSDGRKVAMTVLGIILMLIALTGLTVTGITVASVLGSINSSFLGVSPAEITALIAPNGIGSLVWASVLALAVMPFLFLLYLGIRLVVDFKAYLGAAFAITALVCAGAFGYLVYEGVSVAGEFGTLSTKSENITVVVPSGKTLHIVGSGKADPDFVFDSGSVDNYFLYRDAEEGKVSVCGRPTIRVEYGDSLSCAVISSARGNKMQDAIMHRQQIRYNIFQADSVLYCDKLFYIGGQMPFRVQDVEVVLTLPASMKVDIDEDMTHLVDY